MTSLVAHQVPQPSLAGTKIENFEALAISFGIFTTGVAHVTVQFINRICDHINHRLILTFLQQYSINTVTLYNSDIRTIILSLSLKQ